MSKVDEKAGRDPAPDVEVSVKSLLVDHRKALIDRLDKAEPGFVHMYQSRKVLTADEGAYELEAKNQEVVKGANGKPLHHRGDPVVRMKRELVDAERKAEADLSLKQVKAVVKNKNLTVLRNPKQGGSGK